jgi:hypothetical protein
MHEGGGLVALRAPVQGFGGIGASKRSGGEANGMLRNLFTVIVDDGKIVAVPMIVPSSMVTVGALANAKEKSPKRANEFRNRNCMMRVILNCTLKSLYWLNRCQLCRSLYMWQVQILYKTGRFCGLRLLTLCWAF